MALGGFLGVLILLGCICCLYIFKISKSDKYQEEGMYATFSQRLKAAANDTIDKFGQKRVKKMELN